VGIRIAIVFLLVCAPIQLFAQPAHLVKDIFNLRSIMNELSHCAKRPHTGPTRILPARGSLMSAREEGFRS
jgi:hypothetical protein